jgi:replicative DNA helicase
VSLDLTLLRILKHKDNYDRIVPNLPANALDPKTMAVLKDFGTFLSDTGHPVVKIGAFKTAFFNFYHKGLSAEQAQFYDKMLDKCEKDVDAATTRMMANRLIELGFATDVGNLASDYHRGEEVDIINSVGNKHDQAKVNIMTGETDKLYVTDNIGELLNEDKDLSGLRFQLSCLRDGLRPLRSGDLVIVAGRPDTGKTSFITSELVGIVDSLQEDDIVLWFNNEGEGNRILKRAYQSFLRSDIDELLQKQSAGVLADEYKNAGGSRLRIVDCHDWDSTMVEQVIADTTPKLVIFDMIDNIEFKGNMRKGHDQRTDQILEAQYQWARKLGVKYGHPVIATSQISAEVEQQAETQCWPPMHALKDSKTGKQGAADLMIMIGKSADPLCANDRYISTPKNKLGRGNGSNYIRQQVNFDIARGVYSDPI